MQAVDLKFPGSYTNAKTIRREVAHVISQLEIAASVSTVDGDFAAFLQDAAIKTPGYVAGSLPATQVIVSNGGTVNVENSAGALDSPGTAVVAGGVLSGVQLAATKTIVTTADNITVQNSAGAAVAGSHAATVAAGVLSNVKLAATIAPVANAQAVAVANSASVAVTGTHNVDVAAGVVTRVRLDAGIAPIQNTKADVVVQNSAGAAITSAGVAAVALGVLSNVKLPATIAAVTNGAKVNAVAVTGTGNFATFTVAAGVITGIVLSAS